MSRLIFYKQTIRQLITDLDASILVVAGHKNDRDVLLDLGFTNVVISNIDPRITDTEFHPYRFSFQDAHQLTFDDGEFDFVIAHASLHHCSSPHRALLEMYRVARIGLLAIEARDSLTMKLLKRLNLSPDYEWVGVFCMEEGKRGGVNNTEIPNFIYRWTENEFEKTINSVAPYAKHRFIYKYGFAPPGTPGIVRRDWLKRFVIFALQPIYKLFAFFFPKQQNLFACFVRKPILPDDLHEWVTLCEGKFKFNRAWAEKFLSNSPTSRTS